MSPNDDPLQIVSAADPTSIDDVIKDMEDIDSALSNEDGLK